MKKITLFITISILASFLFAKPAKYDLNYDVTKTFEGNPIIDLNDYACKGINSVSVIFYANKPNKINVLGNNPFTKEWEKVALCEMKGFSDKNYENFFNRDAINWRFFTFKPENKADYNYIIQISEKTLQVRIRPKGEDINTAPLPKINLSDAYVFDIKKIGAEDYVVFRNFTNNEEIKCIPYYFDRKTFKWCHSYETATVKESAKIELIDDEDIDGIPYIALQITPQGNYNFTLYEKNNDLYIDINEGSSAQIDDINFIDE